MNSDQLRSFKAIQDYGNITKAAQKLFTSQPALSTTLRHLEEELDTKLFVRKGRTMELTKDGKILYDYAEAILTMLDDCVRHFEQSKEVDIVKTYRIGGVGASLLLSGYYGISEKEFKMPMIKNSDVMKVIHQPDMTFLIADDKYIDLEDTSIKRKYLYTQQLMLSVKREDPLSQLKTISIEEVCQHKLAGRNGKMGFNNWIGDIQIENNCEIKEVTHMDYILFATEGVYLKRPFLMSSFGQSVSYYTPSFAGRVAIPVTGKYTTRDIYLYYREQDEDTLRPIIALIESNARKIDDADKRIRESN